MTTRADYDEWWCSRCNRTWVAPSLPHAPKCPACGTGGWWRKVVPGPAYEVPDAVP